jgi:UDP-N-acetylmuramate--alanine ligase
MNFSTIKNIYFLGIGGIGMSALAEYFLLRGYLVGGYDKTPSSITDKLAAANVFITFDDQTGSIPEVFLQKESTLIIYTPAIPKYHPQWQFFNLENYQILKRAEILGYIFNSKNGLAIAGSHGKTSVTSLISWILDGTDEGCTAFIGGISKNFDSNLVYNPQSDWIIAEADEFDRSFHRLFPDITLITSIDSDHLDIYGTRDAILKSFQDFIGQIKENGALILNAKLESEIHLDDDLEVYTYSANQDADISLVASRIDQGKFYLTVELPTGELLEDLEFQVPGKVNVENALAAISIAYLLDVPEEILRKRLASFSGVVRRFDYRIRSEKIVFIDDYAHHPYEISSTIESIREIYPGRKICSIFQPHLFSRTRDLSTEFAEALDLCDEVILLDIYPAREIPIPGVTSELILNKLTNPAKQLIPKSELLTALKQMNIDILITMGAGDIDRLVPEIEQMLSQKLN